MTTTAKILYGHGANNFYATKIDVFDAYLWYQDSAGQTHVVVSPLEVDRARKHAQVDKVHALGDVIKELKADGRPCNTVHQALWLIAGDAPHKLVAPRDFPFELADGLQKEGVNIQPAEGSFFPERGIKTADEVRQIREAQALNEQAFARAFAIISESVIGQDELLYWQDEVLTAEKIRGQMNALIAGEGGMPSDVNVACGAQGADPHERGHGPLKAHELIVIDSFPRGAYGNFYHGDLTRTVLKGTPTDEQLRLYQTVKQGQQIALDMLSSRVTGKDVHEAVKQHFQAQGYETGFDAQGRDIGFFHSTGHSIGLEVHDQGPGITRARTNDPKEPDPLPAGLVVTVEPGLYYPNIGGVRIEDIVHVTETGMENLTTLPKELVIA